MRVELKSNGIPDVKHDLYQRWARIRTRSDWSEFWQDQDWIGLQFFRKLADQDWIRLRNFLLFRCDYSEHIKNFSCDSISQIC